MLFFIGFLSGIFIGFLAILWIAKNVCEMSFEAFLDKIDLFLDGKIDGREKNNG